MSQTDTLEPQTGEIGRADPQITGAGRVAGAARSFVRSRSTRRATVLNELLGRSPREAASYETARQLRIL